MSVHPCVCVSVCVFECFVTQKQEQCAFFCPLFSSSEALDEAAGKQAGLSRPLQGAFVPTVLPLLMDKHHVPLPQLDLCLALGRVGHHHTIPATHTHRHIDSYNTHKAVGMSHLNEFVFVCLPLSGQRFRLRPEDHQSAACTCCRGRPGEIGIQGARLPVQRLQPYGPHIALDRTGAGSPL